MSFAPRKRLTKQADIPLFDDRRQRIAPILSPTNVGDSLAATLPPTPMKQLLAADGAGIRMLTADGELAETAYEAARVRYPLVLASSWGELTRELARGDTGVVLLDLQFVGPRLVDRLDQLRASNPSLVVLLAAPRDSAQKVMQLLIDRRVHRVLLKPASVDETRLLFESAVGRYLQERTEELVPFPAAAPETRRRTGRWLVRAAVLVAALLAGEMLLAPLRFWSGAATGTPSDLPALAAFDPFASPQPSRAPAGVEDGASTPSETTAAPSAESAQKPAEKPAQESASALTEQPTSALTEEPGAPTEELAGVPAAEAAGEPVAASSDSVAAAEPERTAAASAIEPTQAERTVPDPDVDIFFNPYLERQLDLAEQRLAEGRLISPSDDSALAYVRQAASIQQESLRLLEVRDAVAGALIDRVPAALAAGDLDRADALISAAFSQGGDAERLSHLDRELDAARAAVAAAERARNSELAALDARRLQSELLAAPVSIADLEFQSSGSADYPPDARARGIEGLVRLEFIVDADGTPVSARVVDADPAGWFESAALKAIHDYRFRPYERDGVAYQRLVRARIGFRLD